MPRKVKKDFDKEQMYSKIMPSIVTPPRSADFSARPGPEEETDEEKGGQQYVMRNFVEDIVMDKLEHTMSTLRCCECERCKKEVMATALNELPPAYAVAAMDELEETVRQLRQAYEVKVASSLIKAVQEVKSDPRH